MNNAWDRGARHMDALTGTSRSSATFEGDTINLPISFGNKDAAAFHRVKSITSAIIKDAELAEAIKESLAQALETGQSLAEWKKDAGTVFDKLGISRLNSWQAEFIYSNESGLAYGAGKWAKLQAVKSSFPYWRFSTMKDHRVRPTHRLLEGKVFAADNKQFFPPIGWLCRCVAIPISRREAENLGITKPDTVTPEMQAELKNAEFVGEKVGLFEDWLNEKMKTLDFLRKELIKAAVADIQLGISETYTAYTASGKFTEVTNNKETGAFIFKHLDADQHDLKANLDAAERLYTNDWSVVINKHGYALNEKNPELTIIDKQGRRWLSDLKTPKTTVSKGVKNAVESAVKQELSHVVIDIATGSSLNNVAEGITRSFGKCHSMQRIIILMGPNAAEITRDDYAMGKVLVELKRRLK